MLRSVAVLLLSLTLASAAQAQVELLEPGEFLLKQGELVLKAPVPKGFQFERARNKDGGMFRRGKGEDPSSLTVIFAHVPSAQNKLLARNPDGARQWFLDWTKEQRFASAGQGTAQVLGKQVTYYVLTGSLEDKRVSRVIVVRIGAEGSQFVGMSMGPADPKNDAVVLALFKSLRVSFRAPKFRGKTIREWRRVREAAQQKLRSVTRPMIEALGHEDPKARLPAAYELLAVWDGAVRWALQRRLRDSNRHRRLMAAWMLAAQEKEERSLKALIEGLGEAQHPVCRRLALEGLRALGIKARSGVPAILRLLSDPSAKVRSRAITTLGQISSDAVRCVPALIKALGDASRDVRASAVLALGRFRGRAAAAHPTLLRLLHQDPAWQVREVAPGALGAIGVKLELTIPALIQALSDDSSRPRSQAAWALARLRAKAVPALIPALQSADPLVRVGAVRALGRMGAHAAPAVPGLVKVAGDGDAKVRQAVVWALGEVGSRAKLAVPALIGRLGDPDPRTRSSAVYSLGLFKATEAVPSLLALLDDPDRRVRYAARSILPKLSKAPKVLAAVEASKQKHRKKQKKGRKKR